MSTFTTDSKKIRELLPNVKLSKHAKRQIAAGEWNEDEVKRYTCSLAIEIGSSDSPTSISANHAYFLNKLAEEGKFDIGARIPLRGHDRTLFELLTKTRRAESVLETLLPDFANPNQLVDGTDAVGWVDAVHPLAYALRNPAKFAVFAKDPRIDITKVKLAVGTKQYDSFAEMCEKSLRETYAIYNNSRRRSGKNSLKNRLKGMCESIAQAQQIGFYTGEIELPGFIEPTKTQAELWLQAQRGEVPISSFSQEHLQGFCSRYGLEKVFAPELWIGQESQELLAIHALHPALQRQIARETAVLQSGSASQSNWQQRISQPQASRHAGIA